MHAFNFWHFASGLALFLFGMIRVEQGLKELAGRSFKKFLQRQTRSPLRAIAGGTVVTAFLQSSSVVLLMVLSFVGAGIMEMRNALAVVLGSNLGTTLDSWVVALVGFKLDIEKLTYPFLSISLLGLIFFRRRRTIRYFSEFIVGFCLLFIGLSWMKISSSVLAERTLSAGFTQLNPYLFIPIGFLVTVIIQSSSATIAIILTAMHHGLLPLDQAAAVVIGSELGTSVKILLGAIGGIPDKKRVALGNFYFNLGTTILAALILYPLLSLINYFIDESQLLIKLVVFQSGINLLSIFVFYPFLKRFASFLEEKYIHEQKEKLTKYIHRSQDFPGRQANELAQMEVRALLAQALQLNRKALEIHKTDTEPGSWVRSFSKLAHPVTSYSEEYERFKLLQGEILDFIQDSLETEGNGTTNNSGLIHACREIIHGVKNLKDIRHNLKDLSDSADDDLFGLYQALQERERTFYDKMEKLVLAETFPEYSVSVTDEYLNQNKSEQEEEIVNLLDMLKAHKISDIKVSTMLNVYREIYSSHKAMINALIALHETQDTPS